MWHNIKNDNFYDDCGRCACPQSILDGGAGNCGNNTHAPNSSQDCYGVCLNGTHARSPHVCIVRVSVSVAELPST